MGKIKDLVCEVEDSLYNELGREPTEAELNHATEEYWQSYNEHLDDLAEQHYQTIVNCDQCKSGVKHLHEPATIDTGYKYRGFTYIGEEMCGSKVMHEVHTPITNHRIQLTNVSPYKNPTKVEFHKFVDSIANEICNSNTGVSDLAAIQKRNLK